MTKERRKKSGPTATVPASTGAAKSAGDPMRGPGLWILVLYLFVALYLVPVFPHGGSANEETRWATAASLVERGSFEISWAEQIFGPNPDTARVGERIYSNKAPASALLAIPGYLAVRPFLGAPSPSNVRISWTVMRWLIATLPLAGLALSLLRRGAPPPLLIAALFGTPLFVYSLLLFSHVLTAAAVYAAYRLLFRRTDGPERNEALLAGLLAGVAVASEFAAVIPVLIFGSGVLLQSSRSFGARGRAALAFVAGGIPCALGLAVYNNALFGSPFALSYAHEAFLEWAEVAQQGVFGISLPKLSNLWLLLLSPSRGLFFMSPVLLLGLASLVRVRGEGKLRAKVRLAAVGGSVLVLAGHGAAHGGWAAGPRYLVFVVPLLVEALCESRLFDRGPTRTVLFAGLALGASVVLSVLPALTFSFAPPEFHLPHASFWRPLLFSDGWAAPTLGALAGLGGGLLALAPVGLTLIAALGICAWAGGRPGLVRSPAGNSPREGQPRVVLSEPKIRRDASEESGEGRAEGVKRGAAPASRAPAFTVGLVLGISLALLYTILPGLDETDGAVRRASIAERFFKHEGRLDRLRAKTTDPAQLRYLDAMDWQVAEMAAVWPSNWPYSDAPLAKEGPASFKRRVVMLQGAGKLAEAEQLLRAGRETFPFAQCEFTDDLGVVLYLSGRKQEAITELESALPLARSRSSPGCRRTLYHLGSLYREMNRPDDALGAYREYLALTEGYPDAETVRARDEARNVVEARSPGTKPR